MPLPAHLVEHMRAMVAAADAGKEPDLADVTAFGDELTAWVGSPEGYVPRAVLADALKPLAAYGPVVEQTGYRPGATFHATLNADDVRRAVDVVAGSPPAWFVLADWGRMTDAEREQAERVYRALGIDPPPTP